MNHSSDFFHEKKTTAEAIAVTERESNATHKNGENNGSQKNNDNDFNYKEKKQRKRFQSQNQPTRCKLCECTFNNLVSKQ